jgi:hypothetical protein
MDVQGERNTCVWGRKVVNKITGHACVWRKRHGEIVQDATADVGCDRQFFGVGFRLEGAGGGGDGLGWFCELKCRWLGTGAGSNKDRETERRDSRQQR